MKLRDWLKRLGPGLVTGAADDDPSGIGTYAQIGAQFGFALLWSAAFALPLMAAVQEICARIGRITGKGLAANMAIYPRWLVVALIVLLVGANVVNIGADIAAMGACATLVAGGPALMYAIAFALLSIALEVFASYERYARWLKWATLTLFAYVAVAFVVDIDWRDVARATLWPHFALQREEMLALTALLGTTISPYLFFWQASQEVQEIRANAHDHALMHAPRQAPDQLRRIRIDTWVGMAISQLVAYFIILTCAATLHAHGVTHVESAAQAAQALRPVAGRFAFALFAGGIIGTGLLAIPVLAGSAAYGLAELQHWRTGLERKPGRAKGFYATIVAAILVGLGVDLLGIDPVRALFIAAVINGIAAVPILALLLLMANDARVVGARFVLPRMLKVFGWLAFAAMALSAAGTFATLGK